MNQLELQKNYSKKPKEILILDCAYLESERRRLEIELRESKREQEIMRQAYDKCIHKNACLNETVKELARRIIAMCDVVGVR